MSLFRYFTQRRPCGSTLGRACSALVSSQLLSSMSVHVANMDPSRPDSAIRALSAIPIVSQPPTRPPPRQIDRQRHFATRTALPCACEWDRNVRACTAATRMKLHTFLCTAATPHHRTTHHGTWSPRRWRTPSPLTSSCPCLPRPLSGDGAACVTCSYLAWWRHLARIWLLYWIRQISAPPLMMPPERQQRHWTRCELWARVCVLWLLHLALPSTCHSCCTVPVRNLLAYRLFCFCIEMENVTCTVDMYLFVHVVDVHHKNTRPITSHCTVTTSCSPTRPTH